MLKKSAGFVLASLRGSTYWHVRLPSSLTTALPDGLFEHPARHPHFGPRLFCLLVFRLTRVFQQPGSGWARRMRSGGWLFATSLALGGCAANADFVHLTKEVAYLRNEQNELKTQVVELKKLATDMVAQQKKERPEYLGSRLDELSVKFDAMTEVQLDLDAKLSGLRRDHEEGTSRIGSVAEDAGTGRTSTAPTPELGRTAEFGDGPIPCVSPDMPAMEPDIQPFLRSEPATEDRTELSAREAFEVAYQDYRDGDYTGAIQGFEAFQRRFPDTSLAVDAQYLVGTSYIRLRDCVRAVAAYEKMVRAFPHHKNNALGLWKLSYLYEAMSDKPQARAVLQQLIERHPQSKEAKLARRRLPEVSQ